jgi:hypothetical protein
MKMEKTLTTDFATTIVSTDGFTVEYSDPLRLDRLDPAWFVWGYGHTFVARVSKQGHSIDIFCDGEMRIHVWDDGSMKHKDAHYDVIRYSDRLEERGFNNDLDLIAAEPRIEWENNAWFDLYWSFGMKDEEGEDWLNCVTHDLSDAVNQAKAVIDDRIAQNLPALD